RLPHGADVHDAVGVDDPRVADEPLRPLGVDGADLVLRVELALRLDDGEHGGELLQRRHNEIAPVVQELLDEANALYASGDSGLGALPWRCGLAIAVASAVYRDIGRVLANQQFNPLSGRAHTTLLRKLFLVGRATMRRVLDLPARMLVEGRAPQTVLTGPPPRPALGQEA
ncbi:MAG: squalene/phytoene synthase family protein, partial [Actinomycetota bacterium]